jgi:anti-sigma factor RsiW
MTALRRRRRTVVCRQLVELVTDFLDGELAPADRAAVEAHLARCEHCTSYLEQVRRMLELSAALPSTHEVPVHLLDALTSRYRRQR